MLDDLVPAFTSLAFIGLAFTGQIFIGLANIAPLTLPMAVSTMILAF